MIFLFLLGISLHSNLAMANGKSVCSQEQTRRGCEPYSYNCTPAPCVRLPDDYSSCSGEAQLCDTMCRCPGDQVLDNRTFQNLMTKFRQEKFFSLER